MRSIRLRLLVGLGAALLGWPGAAVAQGTAQCPNGQLPSGECLEAPLVQGQIRRPPQRVVVSSEPPGAEIRLNDEPVLKPNGDIATTPFEITTRVPPGREIFRFDLARHVSTEVSAIVRPYGTTPVHAKLTALGFVQVVSHAGCVLELKRSAGKDKADYTGQLAPYQGTHLELEPGSYQLACESPYYFKLEQTVDVVSGKTKELNLVLRPRPVTLSVTSKVPQDALDGFRIFKLANEDAPCRPPKGSVFSTRTQVELPEGIGWYCFIAYSHGHAVAVERKQVSELTDAVTLSEPSVEPWVSVVYEGSATLIDECLHPKEGVTESPMLCAAAAHVMRSRLDDVPTTDKRANLADELVPDQSVCEPELELLGKEPTVELVGQLYEAACTPLFPQGCELAGLFYIERASLSKEARPNELVRKATELFARGCQMETGGGGACIRVYSPRRGPRLSSLQVESSCKEGLPWYISDREDQSVLELFGGHSIGDQRPSFFAGASFITREWVTSMEILHAAAKVRALSPILIGYTQHDLSSMTQEEQYLFCAEWGALMGRAYLGPLFLEAGLSLQLVWDSGGGKRFEQSARFDASWIGGGGLRIGPFALSSGVRYFTAIGDVAHVGGRTLYETNGVWIPYVAIETGLNTVDMD
jgi:hypothetical protein